MEKAAWGEAYIDEIAQQSIVANVPLLQQWSRNCLHKFLSMGFPTRRNEDWKYTNVSTIEKKHYVIEKNKKEIDIDKFVIEDTLRLVFINGVFSDNLSDKNLPEGLVVKSLALALEDNTAGCVDILKDEKNLDDPFAKLNASLMTGGIVLHATKNTVVKKPIHLLFINDDSDNVVMHHPRHVIVVDQYAELCVLEDYVGCDGADYFNNIVTQIATANNAVLYYYKCQRESLLAQHIANIQIQQAANSQVLSRQVFIGGDLARENLRFGLNGEGASCQLFGLYLPQGKQHIDNHTEIMHIASHCQSIQDYKGIIAKQGHAVFNGRIVVAKDTLQTVAHQSNKNLLLDKHSAVDTKPELEIYADDVKCSHGATVGQLDKKSLIYLQSRGIPLEYARYLMTRAFAAELLEKIPCEIVGPFLMRQVEQQLNMLYPQGDFDDE